jgi:signal transduction histidine kinase
MPLSYVAIDAARYAIISTPLFSAAGVDVYLPREVAPGPWRRRLPQTTMRTMNKLHSLGWARLLPFAMLWCMVYWGVHPWSWTLVLVTGVAALLVPAVAADLLSGGLIAMGLYSIGLAIWMPGSGSPDAYTAVPGSGPIPPAEFVRSTPLHTLVFGFGWPQCFDACLGAAALGFGLWLIPRTIGAHAALARRNGELASRVSRLTRSRVDATDTAAAELRRVERDLHDGAQARLIALGLSLRATEGLIRTNPDAAVALVAESRENSAKALAELRDLVRGINPPVLAERGLADAVAALALDAVVPVTTDIDLPGRAPEPVETAVYFAVAEILANIAKHAGARHAHITMAYRAGLLRVEVFDDGCGGANPDLGTGLRGVERRLGTFDGVLAISSPAGGPTIVVIEVPCELS